jgi:lysophospholipid acyltransferase (LPLAT)-like uncharacterized protein
MKLKSPLLHKLGGLVLSCVTWRWMATLDFRVALYEPEVDPVHPCFRGPAIYLFWHEYIPFLLTRRGHCNVSLLISRHQDAEWLAEAARHLGFGTVRGSTNRSGTAALREICGLGRARNLAITPDGPRGPRRRLAPGAVYLSSRLGLPLVAIGMGYNSPWRLPTWDRFAVPVPFSRARAVVGPRLQVPSDLDRELLEVWRQRVESHLTGVTELAESWALSGRRMHGELPLHRQCAPAAGGYSTEAEADADANSETGALSIAGSVSKTMAA